MAPVTRYGKMFCIAFVAVGVPYFAYMLNALSGAINEGLGAARRARNIEFNFGLKSTKFRFSLVSFLYIFFGTVSKN